jgi:hypothetical protein
MLHPKRPQERFVRAQYRERARQGGSRRSIRFEYTTVPKPTAAL